MRVPVALLVLTLTFRTQAENVVDVALALGLDKLVDAIVAANLEDEWTDDEATLNLFGPTNAAFTEAENAGLLPNATEELHALLTYHAVSTSLYGELTLDKLQNDVLYETINTGDYMRSNVYQNPDEKVYLCTGAEIDQSQADNEASNGLVQVINKVLLRPTETVYSLILGNENLQTLLTAVNLTDLPDALDGEGNFTLFAPTDAAFAKIPEDDLNDLLEDPEALTGVLLYHTLGSTFYSRGLYDGATLTTLQGETLSVSASEICNTSLPVGACATQKTDGTDALHAGVRLNDEAEVLYADIPVTNGVVHFIDTVLMPPAVQTSTRGQMTTDENAQTSTPGGGGDGDVTTQSLASVCSLSLGFILTSLLLALLLP